ncbi:MAG TPA: Uma2 family endonuclease, partial [Kamptonema sp.]|nr:Uma2 family endonuclease [Kamptonema sp.]
MSVQMQRRLFTVQEYHLMGEAGIFGNNERVELIEGEII